MHITGENTVNRYACVHFVVVYAYYLGKTIQSIAWVHLVVYYDYYW